MSKMIATFPIEKIEFIFWIIMKENVFAKVANEKSAVCVVYYLTFLSNLFM